MKRVLLIEDDKQITLALGVRLKSMGYDVVSAPDAVSAVAQARRHAPDVILIDINLPGGDGFTVAERLRTLAQTSTTPCIVITAGSEPGVERRAEKVGASAFLEKPFDATELADKIEHSLSGGIAVNQ